MTRATGSLREGWLPFNQIGACVPQWLTLTFLVGIFPPTKLLKRYHPALRSLSQSGIWPDVHLACTLLRELSSSMWFPFMQQLLQICWADAAWVKARARMTNLRGKQRVLIFYWDAVSVASCPTSNGFQYKNSIFVSVCTLNSEVVKRYKCCLGTLLCNLTLVRYQNKLEDAFAKTRSKSQAEKEITCKWSLF